MMDILGLHAFWICFHGTEKGKLSKWRIWHYSALTLSCNIYTSKTPFSEHFNLKTAPAKALLLFENNEGAATVEKNVPHPVENPSDLYIQNELGYILKPVMSFLPNQHPLYFNINLFWFWSFSWSVLCVFSDSLCLDSFPRICLKKKCAAEFFFSGLILEHSSMRCRNQNESGLWLFVACCGSLWVFQELPNKCDYQNPNGMGSL